MAVRVVALQLHRSRRAHSLARRLFGCCCADLLERDHICARCILLLLLLHLLLHLHLRIEVHDGRED